MADKPKTKPDKPEPDVQPDQSNTAAEAAAAEARDQALTIYFRGERFVIPQETFTSARLLMAMASYEGHRMMYETLAGDPGNFPKFMATLKVGEDLASVAEEFFAALQQAGQGNS